jgi:hypothetical protein
MNTSNSSSSTTHTTTATASPEKKTEDKVDPMVRRVKSERVKSSNGSSLLLAPFARCLSYPPLLSTDSKNSPLHTLSRYSTSHLGHLTSSATPQRKSQLTSAHRNELHLGALHRDPLFQPSERWKQKCSESKRQYHQLNGRSGSTSFEVGEEEKKVPLFRSSFLV